MGKAGLGLGPAPPTHGHVPACLPACLPAGDADPLALLSHPPHRHPGQQLILHHRIGEPAPASASDGAQLTPRRRCPTACWLACPALTRTRTHAHPWHTHRLGWSPPPHRLGCSLSLGGYQPFAPPPPPADAAGDPRWSVVAPRHLHAAAAAAIRGRGLNHGASYCCCWGGTWSMEPAMLAAGGGAPEHQAEGRGRQLR